MELKFILKVYLLGLIYAVSSSNPCNKRDYGHGSFVCVCDEAECDTVEPNTPQARGLISQYTSSAEKYRLDKRTLKFGKYGPWSYKFKINREKTFQSVIGFGGAFTDAAGINIMNLPPKAQANLLSSYYAPSGIQYTVGRIPMASCDFSTHPYSYDDHPGDLNLTQFALAPEDLKYKIPVIQKALSLSDRNISIFGSPWSAPAWMKTDNNMTGKGSLKGEAGGSYHKAWAKYFIRFLQEYEKHDIKLWGLTAQNEPTDGELHGFFFQCMGWTPEQQRDFIIQDLGPALHDNGFGDVKLMILDDTRLMLPLWVEKVFSNPDASKYVDGVAVHWYEDFIVPPLTLDNTHKKYPSLFLLATEACAGSMFKETHVILGSWVRAQDYVHSIIQDMNHWVSGWTDWNIALDTEGGPNWVKNFVDSPIIVNARAAEFYKQPMFYALGHFSKFVLPGAKRVDVRVFYSPDALEAVAFESPDNSTVLVVHNKDNHSYLICIEDPAIGNVTLELEPLSVHTFIWWSN